ncbi:hypothetical protein NL108_002640, partial [Boleophthalmus pectinirostris]
EELVQMQQEVQRRVQQIERTLKEIPHVTKQHKALVQALQSESTDLFSDLIKAVNGTGIQVGEELSAHEASLGTRVEGRVQRLEQEVARLHWRSEELQRLADMQDHVCFLKNFFLMEPLGQTEADPGLGHQEAVVSSVRSTLRELQVSIENQCKAALTKIQALVNDEAPAPETNDEPAAVPNETQNTGTKNISNCKNVCTLPSSLTHFLSSFSDRFVPTLDPNTAYRHVQISDGGRKATLKAENMNYPERPERFQFWRQVLCSEALGGSPYYWEVEWTGTK